MRRVTGANDPHVETVAHAQVPNGARKRKGVLLAEGKRVGGQPHGNVDGSKLLALVDVDGHHGDARQGGRKVVEPVEVHHLAPLSRKAELSPKREQVRKVENNVDSIVRTQRLVCVYAQRL